jgi:hypothetical protein
MGYLYTLLGLRIRPSFPEMIAPEACGHDSRAALPLTSLYVDQRSILEKLNVPDFADGLRVSPWGRRADTSAVPQLARQLSISLTQDPDRRRWRLRRSCV